MENDFYDYIVRKIDAVSEAIVEVLKKVVSDLGHGQNFTTVSVEEETGKNNFTLNNMVNSMDNKVYRIVDIIRTIHLHIIPKVVDDVEVCSSKTIRRPVRIN